MVTIYDVAKEAGVSIGTVSYVLNDTGRVGPDAARRVRQAIKKLNYHPRVAAKALARGKTGTIALISPAKIYDTQMTLIRLIRAIGNVLSQTGYSLNVVPTFESQDPAKEIESRVRGRQMDGVILLHVELNDSRVELLRKSSLPFVLIGRCEDNAGLYLADADIKAAADLAVDHFYQLGHRRIAMLGESGKAGISTRLMDGFCNSLAAHRLECRPDFIVSYDGEPELAQAAAKQLLSLDTRPGAVFALSDPAVLGVYKAAAELGLRIPQDLAVIGYADSPLYPFLIPACGAVFGDLKHIGEVAARILLQLLRFEEPEQTQVLFPPRLIKRQSTCRIPAP